MLHNFGAMLGTAVITKVVLIVVCSFCYAGVFLLFFKVCTGGKKKKAKKSSGNVHGGINADVWQNTQDYSDRKNKFRQQTNWVAQEQLRLSQEQLQRETEQQIREQTDWLMQQQIESQIAYDTQQFMDQSNFFNNF